jgi:AraC family transcriptional regulator
LFYFLNDFEEKEITQLLSESNPSITCYIDKAKSFKGLIFVGLFPRKIPDQKPSMGTALLSQKRHCTFSDVPPGRYYVLTAGIKWSMKPKDYFVLDKSLRGASDLIDVTTNTNTKINIKLREPLPYDPPNLINLPMLQFEQEKNKAN